MVAEIKGTAHGDARKMLEAAKDLDPSWLQAFDNGRFAIDFNSKQDPPEGDLQFMANVFGFEMEKEIHSGSGWTHYYFQ